MINYGLECFANLGIAYIYHSPHQLFEYKLVLVNLNLEVLTITCVLYTKWAFIIIIIIIIPKKKKITKNKLLFKK